MNPHGIGMSSDLNAIIHAVAAKVPAWIRQDLGAKDTSVRERAEDALAAMIERAIVEAQSTSS